MTPYTIRSTAYRCFATLLVCALLGACSGGSGSGDDIIEAIDEAADNIQPPAEEERPADQATAPNNSKILTGDQIGTGNYANQDLRRQVGFAMLDPDDPGYPLVPPAPGLKVVNVYKLRTEPNLTAGEKLTGTITNTAPHIRCDILFSFVQFLDASGEDTEPPWNGDGADNFSTGPVRKAASEALVSQCLDPGETAYFGTQNIGFDYEPVDSVRLAFSASRPIVFAPPESVMPVSYTATLSDVYPFTEVELTIKNVGPATVGYRAATLIAIDENAIPLDVMRDELHINSPEWPKLLKPGEEMVVEFSTRFQGTANSVHASVVFDECVDCNE